MGQGSEGAGEGVRDGAAAGTQAWWRSASVVQVYLRSLQDSDGDGVGDLPGALSRLDALVELGVDTLWLSPVHPSPDVDFGYDVADYDGVHPTLGTAADLDALLRAAGDRGLRVLLDGVFNHTSDQHRWFRASREDPDGPFGPWYHWRPDPSGSAHPTRRPNNWQSALGGPGWTWDATRRAWYLHSFAPEQPDLNWAHEPVAEAVLASMERWLSRGVSGFRLDVFNLYCKHPELPDNPRRWDLLGLMAAPAYGYLGQHHLHDRDQPALGEVLGRLRALADRHGAVLVGETLDERLRYANAAPWVGPGRLHLAFHFQLLHSRWGAAPFARAIQAWVDQLGPEGWPTWVVGNHDFRRVASRWGTRDPAVTTERLRLVALLLCTLRGTPFVYQGDDLGLPEGHLARAEIVDPPGRRYWPLFRGRDGCRTPYLWEDREHGGFTTGQPWLPLAGDPARQAWAVQRGEPGSVWSGWRAALVLRAGSSVLRSGAQGPVEARGTVLRFTRGRGEEALEVVLNLGARPVDLPDSVEVVHSTHPAADPVCLRPREGQVRRRSEVG